MSTTPKTTGKMPTVLQQGTVRQLIATIDEAGKGIALVVDDANRLVNTITDGDVRRAMLAGIDLDAPIAKLLERKSQGTNSAAPVTAKVGTAPATLVRTMARHSIRQIPILDAAGTLVNLVAVDELLPGLQPMPEPEAVVMAGGFGTRLRPLTDNVPKPMLPVGGRPLLEHIVDQLRDAGIDRLHLTTHYLADSITSHFGDGHRFGVDISYVNEDKPLGTAGALHLLKPWNATLLVVNGDILSGVNFHDLIAFHRDNHASMTVAVRKFEVQVPYGVMDIEGVDIRHLDEKPLLRFFVNAGIYLLEPHVYSYIPQDDRRCDMTDLIQSLLDNGHRVTSFPLHEYWLDVGRPSDYEKANSEFSGSKKA